MVFLLRIGHFNLIIYTFIVIIYFEILPGCSILLIAYFLIAVCCEVPQTIMDVALYEIKYYNKAYNFLQVVVMIIIIILFISN